MGATSAGDAPELWRPKATVQYRPAEPACPSLSTAQDATRQDGRASRRPVHPEAAGARDRGSLGPWARLARAFRARDCGLSSPFASLTLQTQRGAAHTPGICHMG